MEKFSIDDEDENEKLNINPVFIKALPKYMMEKGTIVANHPSVLIPCIIHRERKGISGIFLRSEKRINRLLGFEDEYIYGYEKTRYGLVVRLIWSLRRLYKLEIKRENNQFMSLYFIGRSLNPIDPFKVKKLQILNNKQFLNSLKCQLDNCDIDLEF